MRSITRASAPRSLLAFSGAIALALSPGQSAAQEQTEAVVFHACYVPASGTVYRIMVAGGRDECSGRQHVHFSWTDGAVADGSITTDKVDDGAVTEPKLGFDPATQEELDAYVSRLQSAGTLDQDDNPVDWTQLKNLPEGFADGVDDGGGVASDIECDGCVATTDIAPGTSVDLLGGLASAAFALAAHDHDGSYAALSHDHAGSYAAVSHNHDDRYVRTRDLEGTPIELLLNSGWSNFGDPYGGAEATRTAGVVTLTGVVFGDEPGVILNLPDDYRPAARLIFMVLTNGGVTRVDILPSGHVELVTPANDWVSLSGITFPARLPNF